MEVYGDIIAKCVVELATTFASQRHSGQSATIVIEEFYRMCNKWGEK